MSQRATGVAWGAIPEYLLAKVREVTMVPCFPGSGASGKFCPSLGGPIRRAHFLSRLSSVPPTPGTAAGESHHSPRVASFYLRALQEGPGFWPALAAVPPGGGCQK